MSILSALGGLIRQITRVEGDVASLKRLEVRNPFSAGKASVKTIASGVISVAKPFVLLLPESGTADNLDTISNFADGKMIILSTADVGDTITVRDESISGGNIVLRGVTSRALADPEDLLLLIYKESEGFWVQMTAPPGGSGGTPDAHAASHQHSGTDEVATATPAANAIVKAAGTGKIANGWLDATLESLAALGTTADRMAYTTGVDTWAETPLTAFARTMLDDANQAAVQATLALVPGTDVQAQDAELQAIAGLTSAADRLPYFTGSGTASLATFTAYGRTLAALADAAAHAVVLATAIDGTSDGGAPADTDQIPVIRAGAIVTVLWSAMKTALNALYVTVTGNQNVAGLKTFTDNLTQLSTGAAAIIDSISDGNQGVMRATSYRASPFGSVFLMQSARGSLASPTVSLDGDRIGSFTAQGYSANAAAFIAAAQINFFVNGTPDSGGDTSDMPGMITFQTSPEGSASPQTALIVDSNQNVAVAPAVSASGAKLFVLQGVLASPVARLELDTAGTNPFLNWFLGRVLTTNSTTATLFTFPIATDTIRFLDIRVGARRTGGGSATGAVGDGASFTLEGTYKNVAGTVTLIDVLVSVPHVEAGGASVAWTATLTISGTDVLLRVTGASSMNIDWWMIRGESSQL